MLPIQLVCDPRALTMGLSLAFVVARANYNEAACLAELPTYLPLLFLNHEQGLLSRMATPRMARLRSGEDPGGCMRRPD